MDKIKKNLQYIKNPLDPTLALFLHYEEFLMHFVLDNNTTVQPHRPIFQQKGPAEVPHSMRHTQPAFLYTEGVEVADHVVSVIVDPSVITIEIEAFCLRRSLKSVDLPTSVITIKRSAFSHCTSLIHAPLPDSLSSIGSYAFSHCTSLGSVYLPDSLNTIDRNAFSECTSLSSVRLPHILSTIGDFAFSHCTSLISVCLPHSLTTISCGLFSDCTSLTSVRLPESLSIIGKCAFSQCLNLSTVCFPDSLSVIGNCAFSGCTSLSLLRLPDSVCSIGYNAFSKCTGLTSVCLPYSLSTISLNAFKGCISLKTITAPSFPTPIIKPNSLKEALMEASFFPIQISHVLNKQRQSSKYVHQYHNWKMGAKITDDCGRLPLCIAAERSLKWSRWLQKIFHANMPAIEITDPVTALEPFMLAAVGVDSDFEAVYALLRGYPVAIGWSIIG